MRASPGPPPYVSPVQHRAVRAGEVGAGNSGVYVTRPERIIWPVVALVAVTLFSAAFEATAARVRSAIERHQAVASEASPTEDRLEDGHGLPGEELKTAGRPGIVARPGHRHATPDLRSPARRSATVTVARIPVLEPRALQARTRRPVVVSSHRGGLVLYFPTAPPAPPGSRTT
jgi:hypothetical protein